MATFLTLKEKILTFLSEMGIRKVDFYENTGIQASNFKGVNLKSAPGGDMLVKILTTYPSLSAEWLLRGNGPMLLNPEHTVNSHATQSTPTENTNTASSIPYEVYKQMIDERDEKIGDLRETIGDLKARISMMEVESNPSVAPRYAPYSIEKIAEP